ncbi:MAG: glycosyltransferase family 2 protein [Alphaproteobacteria bacterium]
MASDPYISVIIPHLNQPDLLKRCLDSLQMQTVSADRFEVIVVDNGSSDLPVDVIQHFPNVRLCQESQAGPGPARNKGVEESQGDLLAFIDSDCYADPAWLETVKTCLTRTGAPPVIGGDVRIPLAQPPHPTMIEAYEIVFSFRQKFYIEHHGYSVTANLAMTRSAFDLVGGFGTISIAEDMDWGRRARQVGLEIAFEPTMVVFHPARTSFQALRKKCSRLNAHRFHEWQAAHRGQVSWLMSALLIAVSPVRDVPRTLASSRLDRLPDRLKAAYVLLAVRFFRALDMVELWRDPAHRNAGVVWNR